MSKKNEEFKLFFFSKKELVLIFPSKTMGDPSSRREEAEGVHGAGLIIFPTVHKFRDYVFLRFRLLKF